MMRNGSTNYRHKFFGVVLNDGHVVGRIFKHSQEFRGSGQSLLANIRQPRLFSDTRAAIDGGFQEAVGKLSSRQLPNINFDERLL